MRRKQAELGTAASSFHPAQAAAVYAALRRYRLPQPAVPCASV
jgi:hypothetical protein